MSIVGSSVDTRGRRNDRLDLPLRMRRQSRRSNNARSSRHRQHPAAASTDASTTSTEDRLLQPPLLPSSPSSVNGASCEGTEGDFSHLSPHGSASYVRGSDFFLIIIVSRS